MRKFLSKFFISAIICSIALIAFGILLIVKSDATIVTVSYVIGGLLIALGVIAEIGYIKNIASESKNELNIIYGLACAILGILVIQHPKAIQGVISLVLGIIIVVNSATKLQYSFELKKEKNILWIATLILSIVMAVCGAVLIFNPFEKSAMRIIGVFILVYAILDLASTIVIKRTLKQIREIIETPIKEASIIEEKTTKEIEKKDDKDE